MLSTHSFDSLSLREVARESGISPNAFYRHFDGMDSDCKGGSPPMWEPGHRTARDGGRLRAWGIGMLAAALVASVTGFALDTTAADARNHVWHRAEHGNGPPPHDAPRGRPKRGMRAPVARPGAEAHQVG